MVLGESLSLFIIIMWTQRACGLTFEHPQLESQDLVDIKFVQQDSWYTGQNAYHKDSAIWLNPDPREVQSLKLSNIGRVVYKDPVRFLDPNSTTPNQVVSFNTSFSFQIITISPYLESGSGMTFFVSDSEKAPNNSYGGRLGLIDPNATEGATRFFAVEFDTHLSTRYEDPSASHIGININSLKSLNVTDTQPGSSSPFYPELYLYNNYTFAAWIEYDASVHRIQVWMTNATSQQRPSQPCLELSYDLSVIFQEFMYVGFTGTNEPANDSMEGHALYSWSFSIQNFSEIDVGQIVDSGSSNRNMVVIGVASSIAVLVLLCIVGCLTTFLVKRKKKRAAEVPTPSAVAQREEESSIALSSVGSRIRRYTFTDLEVATDGFNEQNKIGSGGFSTVYKGALPDGSMVAVKKLRDHLRRESDFVSEINIISDIRHRNLLQLQGWCYERGEALLIYKFMSNGSLDTYVYGKRRGALQSATRFRAILGVASALEYLHFGLSGCVLHRDVKAANVMLTDRLEPVLGDFGLARLIGHDQAVTMTRVGTPGYVAPEVLLDGKVTDKTDVYSFGILMLELACGRPAIAVSPADREIPLVNWVWKLKQSNIDLISALDESMMVDSMSALEKEKWRSVLVLALMCCSFSPDARPTMKQISQTLQGDNLVLPNWQASLMSGKGGNASSHFDSTAPYGCSTSSPAQSGGLTTSSSHQYAFSLSSRSSNSYRQ